MRTYWAIGCVFLAAACATARPQRAEHISGQVPLRVTVRGSLYTGTAALAKQSDNMLGGTFTLAGPVEVKGTANASVTGEAVRLVLTYTIAANGCKGTMNLNGTFTAPDTRVVEGSAEAEDSCVGRMTGTFRLGE